MRTHGKLTKWNDDRGFGFIEPSAGTDEIFVHVSSFPRYGARPRIGEFISFDIEQRADGKKQAVRVMRPGARAVSARRTGRTSPAAARQGMFASMISVLLMLAIGWYAYTRINAGRTPSPTAAVPSITQVAPETPEASFSCDGRTRCSQMHSCAEATYFSHQCPGTQMDGDGDGVPCESQWCNSRSED